MENNESEIERVFKKESFQKAQSSREWKRLESFLFVSLCQFYYHNFQYVLPIAHHQTIAKIVCEKFSEELSVSETEKSKVNILIRKFSDTFCPVAAIKSWKINSVRFHSKLFSYVLNRKVN